MAMKKLTPKLHPSKCPTTLYPPTFVVQRWVSSNSLSSSGWTWQTDRDLSSKLQQRRGELTAGDLANSDLTKIKELTLYASQALKAILEENYVTGQFRVLLVAGEVILDSQPPKKPAPEVGNVSSSMPEFPMSSSTEPLDGDDEDDEEEEWEEDEV